MKRRLLSAFLAVMMVLTMAPVAFAADGVEPTDGTGSSEAAPAETLQRQIDGIEGTGTVTLDKDYTEDITIKQNQNITLNLNGMKLTNKTGHTITVEQGATLTIEGNGTVDNVTNSKTTVYNKGTVVLNGGTYTRSLEDGVDANNAGTNTSYTVLNHGKMTINGGVTIENKGHYSSMLENGYYDGYAASLDGVQKPEMVINGGTFDGGLNTVKNDDNATLTINDGSFSNYTQAAFQNHHVATINGGTFNAKGVYAVINCGSNCNSINEEHGKHFTQITGGIFNGGVMRSIGNIKITGGAFTADVSAYVAEGYVQSENGTVEQLCETNAVAKIGNTYYKSLVDAYAALPRGEGAAPSAPTTITLLKDSEGGGIGSDKTDSYMNYVIDFNGHTYTVGAPAVGSTGTVSQGIRVLKTSTAKFMNGTLKAANYKDLIQVVHTYGDVTFQDFTVDATEDAYAWAAVESDAGTLKVLGNSSILARKGQYGLYAAFWHTGSYDGTTVDVDTTGKITGKLAYEFDEDYTGENKATENKGFVNIKNGNFDILSIQEIWSDVSDEVDKNVGGIIISGGYFTVDPTEYLVNGYVAATSDKSGYDYMVTKKTDTGSITVKPAVAEPEVNVSDKISESDKAKVEDAAKSVEVPTLGAAAGDKVAAISKTDAESLVAEAPNLQNPTLYVQTALKVEPTAYNAENKTLALEITPQYRVVASTATTADEIKLDKNAQVVQDYQPMNITKATVVTMELPADFASGVDKLSIQHTKSNGTVEYYTGTVTEQNGKHLLTFTTNGFSPFVISVPAASIGENVYPTLQAAVDSVESGKTIKLEQAVAPDTKVTVAKTIKFEVATNEKTFAKENIVAGANTTVKVTGDASPYTYEFTYTKPSSGGSSGGSSSGKTTYKVTTSAVNNGGVNASPSSAEKGAAITITLSPDKGYKLDKLTVTDGSGKTVSTVKKSDTVYTFTMPASAVNVGVSYVKATETPSETKFNDVSANDWFASAVDYVTGKGMMNGTADNTFSPKANTTRGMVVTVLYRLENQPSTSAASFTDVASGAYYANAVAWANANGIVSGYGSGKFGPNDKVTREQLAAILYRYAQYKKYDVSVGEDTNILSYNDAQSISSYAIPAIQWACGAGVVTGKSGSKLDPKGNATRAEVAAMLMRFCENVK